MHKDGDFYVLCWQTTAQAYTQYKPILRSTRMWHRQFFNNQQQYTRLIYRWCNEKYSSWNVDTNWLRILPFNWETQTRPFCLGFKEQAAHRTLKVVFDDFLGPSCMHFPGLSKTVYGMLLQLKKLEPQPWFTATPNSECNRNHSFRHLSSWWCWMRGNGYHPQSKSGSRRPFLTDVSSDKMSALALMTAHWEHPPSPAHKICAQVVPFAFDSQSLKSHVWMLHE